MGPHHSRKKLPPSPLSTTRIEPDQVSAISFPKTPVGVDVISVGEERLGERIWVGGSVHGVEITRHLRFFHLDAPELRASLFTALRALDGSRSIGEIATSLQIPTEDFARILLYLEGEGLLHFHSQRIEGRDLLRNTERKRRFTSERSSQGSRSELTRREIEREHLPRGTSLRRRTEQSIAIVSDQALSISPIATSLASLLFGSGFTRIKFIRQEPLLGRERSERVSDLDLGLSIFHGSDIGAEKDERLQELAHRSAILPLEESSGQANPWIASDFDATLTISIGYPRPDHHQRWLSEDRPFLIVPGYSQREISIGPIVIPGRTPCLRCFELNQVENDFWREQSRQLQLLEPSIDPPKVASHLIASLTALYATSWLDSDEESRGSHLLVGHQLCFTFDPAPNPVLESAIDPALDPSLSASPMRLRRWHNHPECGCLWLMPASAG